MQFIVTIIKFYGKYRTILTRPIIFLFFLIVDAYSDKDVQFKWLPDSDKATAIWVEEKIQLPQFKILGYNNLEHTIQYYGKLNTPHMYLF